eukprot:gnl/MRDRNA2_/MRDRNA2_157805_c0_seq1.p1 gnl/MRDRNA2_/MRDRNA2_157805_c0~~gnl/MRDRNA2_/MRDRNA2_157805_c0_seq1.p1  ORF type:complete len:224 (-),score=53.26 gnl/MRDRNA2_/MRDRNA2_157805_c0_seq1:473-1096(-)
MSDLTIKARSVSHALQIIDELLAPETNVKTKAKQRRKQRKSQSNVLQVKALYLSLCTGGTQADAARGIRVVSAVEFKELAVALGQFHQLTTLTLNLTSVGNKIGDAGAKDLAEVFGQMPELTTLTLYLWDNAIGDAGAKELAEGLRQLQKLTVLTLELYYNSIGEAGAKELAGALRQLQKLSTSTMKLGNNSVMRQQLCSGGAERGS